MSHSNLLLRRAIASALALSCAMTATATWADGSPSSAITLDAVIVTAQKREQNIQDVPIVVTSVSAQMMKDAGVTDIKSLTVLTPGLTVTSTSSEGITTARIRGIGTVGDNPGLESSVGIVIDGVYRPRDGVGFGSLGELDHIEVLNGPQGTLFGKNNDAGVINIVTARPSKTFGVTAEVTGGNYNDREASASITGPIGDIASARLYAGYGKRDGFLDINDGTGPSTQTKANDRNFYTTRGQFLLTPNDDVSLLLIGDYSKRNEVCCAAVQILEGPGTPALNGLAGSGFFGNSGAGVSTTNPLQPYDRQAYANQPGTQQIRDMGGSAELNWNFGGVKLTSITAARDWTIVTGGDTDYSGLDILTSPTNGSNSNDFKQYSEELRLAGQTDRISWLFGVFGADEILQDDASIVAGNAMGAYINLLATNPNTGLTPFPQNAPPNFTNAGSIDAHHQTSKSYAAFTNETFKLSDALDLIIGLRYTTEKKDETSSYYEKDGGAGCLGVLSQYLSGPPGNALGYGCATLFSPAFADLQNAQSLSENNLSGTAKFAYHITDGIMAYASYANGYKAGGFNLDRVTDPATNAPVLDTHFDKETVNSYELGLKSTLADKTVRLNVAVFDQKYKDFQLNTFTGIVFVVTSLPGVESKGADLDMNWATPLHGLTLGGGVTYANTEITDFGTALPFFCPNPNNCPTSPRLNDRLSFAPLWSGAVSATYEVSLSDALVLRTNLSEKYMSAYDTGSDLDPRKVQGAYGLLNARIGLGSSDNKWTVELWAQNLTDKGYYQVGFDSPFQPFSLDAFLGDPRTFGVTARVKF